MWGAKKTPDPFSLQPVFPVASATKTPDPFSFSSIATVIRLRIAAIELALAEG